MRLRPIVMALLLGVTASLIGAIIYDAIKPSTFMTCIPLSTKLYIMAVILVICLLSYISFKLKNKYMSFAPYMSIKSIRDRIQSAESEIWSFQISGAEFTLHCIDAYDQWLTCDVKRRIKFLFANPNDDELLKNIVRLSGNGIISSPSTALADLHQTIKTSLDKYSALRSKFNSQVEIKVYDFCPPCSIHAVDPMDNSTHSSIFIENYLPYLPGYERPCLLLSRYSPKFGVYTAQCLKWFDEAKPPG